MLKININDCKNILDILKKYDIEKITIDRKNHKIITKYKGV